MRSFFRNLVMSGLAAVSAMATPNAANAAPAVAPTDVSASPNSSQAVRTVRARTDARVALGLIVKLKGLDREVALPATAQRVQQRAQRLGRLARLAGYPATMPWAYAGQAMSHMKVPTPLTRAQAAAMVNQLMASGEVEWVEPNVMEKLHQASPVPNPGGRPNDAYVTDGKQWWIEDVNRLSDPPLTGVPNVLKAWAIHRGASSGQAVVAVLDTGVLTAGSQELAGRMLPGYDFVSEQVYDRDGQPGRDADASDPGDWLTAAQQSAQALFRDCDVQNSSWHGTEVAGMLGAVTNNGAGIAGMHWDARILPVRVSGICGASLVDIIDAMRWAGGLPVTNVPNNPNPARIINISFGGDGVCGPAYQNVINDLRAAGVLVVASAGNEQAFVTRPASCSGVVAVAALGKTGLKAHYSGFGPQVTVATIGGDTSSLGAWGAQLGDAGLPTLSHDSTTSPSTGVHGIAMHAAGTSFSAPIVSAVAALMWELNPHLTLEQVIEGLKVSARPHVTSQHVPTCSTQNPGRCLCTTQTCGEGILDAERALQYAQSPLDFVSTHMIAAVSVDSPTVLAAVALGPDAPPHVPQADTTIRSGGGGGGGAADVLSLLALMGALLVARWQRFQAPCRLNACKP